MVREGMVMLDGNFIAKSLLGYPILPYWVKIMPKYKKEG